MKKVLVLSSGVVHPNLKCRKLLKEYLTQQMKRIDFRFSNEVEDITLLKQGGYDGVLLYFHRSQISEKAVSVLEDFIFNGGGLLALHSASASFRGNKKYHDLIGGEVDRYGEVKGFRVQPYPGRLTIFKGIKGFGIVDELYVHQFSEDVEIHFAVNRNGRKEPVVWTRELGKGRVSYCSLGHLPETIQNRNFEAIVRRCLNWVTRRSN